MGQGIEVRMGGAGGQTPRERRRGGAAPETRNRRPRPASVSMGTMGEERMADPVLPFFESLGRAFAPKVALARGVELGLAALVALLLALYFSRPLRRRWERARRFRRLMRERGLSASERREVAAMAREGATEPLAVLERREEFERATARALRRSTAGEMPSLVRRLRRAFSFDRVPPSAALLSSRELEPGALLLLGALPARVTAVTEEVLAAATSQEPALRPGDLATVALSRGRDARYRLRCLVRSVEQAAPEGFIVQLEHDEAPERIQARAAVRVPVHGGVGLTRLGPGGAPVEPAAALLAELLDLSGGGALVSSHGRIARGERYLLSFGAAGARFENLRAEVLRTDEGPGGTCRAHLAFRGLDGALRDRLVGAVTRVDLAGQAERKFGPEG